MSPRSSPAVADTDLVVLADASDSFATKRAALATLGTHFGGGGTDDQTAAEVPYTSDAGGNLPATITEVQAALDAIDSFELENTFRGAYDSNRTYDGGEMVIYQGLEYISLIRNNTREPTRSEEQWSAQPRGYIFRGDAPAASTTYQQSHMVRIPSENSWYMATLQGGAQATRAQIPTHTDFQPFTNQLTDANVANASASIKGTISGEQLHDFAPELGIAEATSKVSDEFGRVSGRRIGEAIDAHVVPSTNATTDIGAASAIGTSLELSRDDHEHRLPIDNTLAFNSSDELAVNVHDVIETLQERIRYFTDVRSFTSDAGASVGQVYTTSPYDKVITKIEAHFAPLSGADSFIVRLDEVEENNSIKTKLFTSQTHDAPFPAGGQIRAFRFHDANGDPGVRIDGSIRLAILLSRTGDDSDSAVQCDHGAESDDSPAETYDDASVDFDLVNGVVYQHMNPAIGASTHSHDTQIRCNFRIFYEDIIDHGNLVGDGNVNAQHIDSGSADDGDVLTADGSSGATWETPTGGGGGGGTDDQTAAEVTVDTTNFSRNLTSADDSVQDALETIDGFTQYQGAWQQASWPAGVIVTRSGVAYISLVNGNTEIPTPFSENWSALVEGLAYRGEAPVLATSYSYGQVVLNPANDNYYFYTSTISASVARADIATHANFHGIVIQATEANKGGVRGATAGQAIATSGTTILGWSNNRVRQLVSSALPAMTQADIDNATTGRKSVTGALIASNAGGGTELTQAQVEDETDTTFGSVSGERLAQAVAVFAPATTAPDRIVLADAVGVSNTAGPHEITLTEAMVARQIVTFHIVTSGATNPDAVGYLLSDDILDLDAEATAPSDSENGLPFTTTNYTQTSITSQGGNYFVFRKDDSTLWVRPTRLAAHALTITATPLGGGGALDRRPAGRRRADSSSAQHHHCSVAAVGIQLHHRMGRG